MMIAIGACGRIGFDEVHVTVEAGAVGTEAGVSSLGIDASTIDAPLVTGDGSVAGCHFVACAPGSVACCVDFETSCVSATCTGKEYQCGTCATGICCEQPGDDGTFCLNGTKCPI